MAVTAAVGTVVAAASAVSFGTLNYIQSQDAANAQKNLEDQQAAQLTAEQQSANKLAATEATTGESFGREDPTKIAATGLGFTTNAGRTGMGRAQLVGEGS